MKIKKGLFTTEIEIEPGELTDFLHRERPELFNTLIRWLGKYLDLKLVSKPIKEDC
ncbi:MAG: hypothetical protein UW18_C0017G0002 [Microgenomates group bacterium GW2011_GWF1_44_10]|nr:MAG: hypothetical protein UW18_C0017G0002 [Microgenomates group bacterium GW2011_GWF1_44_10]